MSTKEWLQQEPLPEEISKNNDGSEFIPIVTVENFLDYYTEGRWGTRAFKCFFHVYGTTLLISASVELLICERDPSGKSIKRVLVGAATFTDDKHGSNLDFAATALSECIKNAAKKIGPRFGKNLNGRGRDLITAQGGEFVKPIMDVVTAQKYKLAKLNGDTKTQLEIENYYQL